MDLEPLGTLSPKSLIDTRVELHWAAQILAAIADAWLVPRRDDSHASFGWERELGAFVGHRRADNAVGLRVTDFTLLALNAGTVRDELALAGRTLAEGLAWADARMAAATSDFRRAPHWPSYDMPEHRVQSGAPFEIATEPLRELAAWYSSADAILRTTAALEPSATEVRCWPHHFDIATIAYLDPSRADATGPRIGFGMSPGDSSYAEPYFYVTPYPLRDGVELPLLPDGRWHTGGWVGAVLTATHALSTGDPRAAAAVFLVEAIRACRPLIAVS